jgi:hypothetical protein
MNTKPYIDSVATTVDTMNPQNLKIAVILSTALFVALPGHGQSSQLYMISSPNIIYPMDTTYVYQGGQLLRSWAAVNAYEIPLAVVGGTVRQGAEQGGFSGTEYTQAGVPTGTHYTGAPYVFDAGSDGSSIYGWRCDTATLIRYDLNWKSQGSLFSLGSSYDYSFMGITYDPQNNSVWLAPWGSGNRPTTGYLYDYSLSGQLLAKVTLSVANAEGSGLAYDLADNTLWMFDWNNNRLEQYSQSGTLLSTIDGVTRVYGLEFGAVPEPSSLTLIGAATPLVFARRFGRRQ